MVTLMKKQDDQTKPKINEVVEDLKRQAEEWKNKYLRALADYQNLERRNREEKEEVRKFASEIILGRLLSAIDTLRRAKMHLGDPGLDLAYREFMAILEEQGVGKIKSVGIPFNPHEMECIEVVKGEDNIVVEEVLPGFRLHGKILRVAQVKVGKKMD